MSETAATAPNLPEIDPASEIPPAELDQITEGLVAALKTVYDPEIPVDIYELGLIYKIEIDDSKFVSIDMTLTAPGCPVAGEMPGGVAKAAAGGPGPPRARTAPSSHPPWDQSRMSDEARVALDMW